MPIVLDTNVLISGLLNPNGAPGRIIDLILNQQVQIAIDDRIVQEYVAVLSRPKFGFDGRKIREVVSFLQLTSTMVYAPPLFVPIGLSY